MEKHGGVQMGKHVATNRKVYLFVLAVSIRGTFDAINIDLLSGGGG